LREGDGTRGELKKIWGDKNKKVGDVTNETGRGAGLSAQSGQGTSTA